MGALECPGCFEVSFFSEPSLLIAPDFADHPIIEVFDDVEVVEYRLDPFAALLEGLLEIGIHVAGDSFTLSIHSIPTWSMKS